MPSVLNHSCHASLRSCITLSWIPQCCIIPVLDPSCPGSFLSWILPVLVPSCPAILRSLIPLVLDPSGPVSFMSAYLMSCISHVLHISCPAYLMSCISHVLHLPCPSYLMSCISHVLHISCPASLPTCVPPICIPPFAPQYRAKNFLNPQSLKMLFFSMILTSSAYCLYEYVYCMGNGHTSPKKLN